MKKIISIVITLFVILGCSNPLETKNDQDSSTGGVSFTLPAVSRGYVVTPASYTIQLVNSEISYDNTLTGKPGETVSITSLIPGDYTITVKGLDADSNQIMSGETIVTVEIGKVADAPIQLQYTTGGINVELDLPALIEEPPTTPQRIKRNGNGEFFYDEDGFISRIEVKGSGEDYYVEYTISEGKRTGSAIYSKGETDYELEGTTTIEHDANGREVLETSYNINEEVVKTVSVEFDDINGTRKVTTTALDYNFMTSEMEMFISSIESFDSLGRLVEKANRLNIADSFWIKIYGKWWGEEYYEKMFTKKLAYWGDTWLIEKEEIYMDDELLTTCDYVVKEPGYYVYGEVQDKYGEFIQALTFSPLFELNNLFGQTIIPSKPRNIDNLHLMENLEYGPVTLKYSRDFNHYYSADWPIVFEEGERKWSLIEPAL